MTETNTELFEKAIRTRGVGSEITCAQAMAICNMFGFDRAEFRKYCDAKGIKFKECTFGCF